MGDFFDPSEPELFEKLKIISSRRSSDLNALQEKFKDCEPLIKELKYVQKDARQLEEDYDARPAKEKLAVFSSWLKEQDNSIFVDEKFTFTQSPELGTHCIAARNLTKGELFVSVPRSIMISMTDVYNSTVGSFLNEDQVCRNMPNMLLALFIMFEKKSGISKWKPYIDTLPKKFSLPMFFSWQELQFLIGSRTLVDVLQLSVSQVMNYIYFRHRLSKTDMKLFTFQEFQWACAVVMSRQNRIPIPGTPEDAPEFELALIPAWDMCSHSDGELMTFFNPENDRSESLCMAAVLKGDPIYICYGNRPNSELFIHMGFVYENNSFDFVSLSVRGLSEKDPLFRIKHLFLKKIGMIPTRDFILKMDCALDSELLQYYRILSMTKEDTLLYMRSGQKLASVSISNDIDALNLILDSLHELTGKYNAAGIGCDDSENVSLIIELCNREKMIIRYTVKLVTDKLKECCLNGNNK
eukprot:727275_1